MDEDRITEVLRAKRVGHEVPGMRTWEPLQAGHAGETWPRPRARTTAAKAAQSFDADEDELRGADEIALGYQARQPHQEGVSTSSTDAHKELLAVQSYEATRKGMTEWTVRRVGRRPGCNAALPAGCHDELDGNRLRPHPETDR